MVSSLLLFVQRQLGQITRSLGWMDLFFSMVYFCFTLNCDSFVRSFVSQIDALTFLPLHLFDLVSFRFYQRHIVVSSSTDHFNWAMPTSTQLSSWGVFLVRWLLFTAHTSAGKHTREPNQTCVKAVSRPLVHRTSEKMRQRKHSLTEIGTTSMDGSDRVFRYEKSIAWLAGLFEGFLGEDMKY